MNSKLLVSLVCPFYNEEMGIEAFYEAVTQEITQLDGFEFEIICVDDGSKDSTLKQLVELSENDARIKVIELSRNFGKEAALTAGLDQASGDLIIPLDSDLQDPPALIGQLIHTWEANDVDVVLAKRVDRQSDSLSKRLSAAAFYDTYNFLAHIKIPTNVGDCRLMTRIVVDALKLLPEKQRFMKGLFAWVGFKTITIEYVRQARSSGNTKFSGWKLWNFALEGITSFSSLPLRVWTYLGVTGAFITVLYGLFILIRTLIFGVDLPGYPSLFVAVLFLGSVQLIGIGVLGEYIGRTYMEAKCRPTYLIRKTYRRESFRVVP
ncbi:MAG: glycosyltransferase family 2 protein [Burkholderiaceae bacterium]|jgi:polyisoprenyl-phosphate glycosyltransferase|nr:glycosyltransferase family 2 protein [Burkholderiaceae bacterium]MDP4969340.1 glycosyltransferase family 2 protein [Burkholderiaceae bacterium]MDP5111288.1 glycosyltransferase family 2 protein [Burkholderiaceae bacterium]